MSDVNAVNGASSDGLRVRPERRFKAVNLEQLLQMKIEDVQMLVEQILAVGLGILAGRPKDGKSWFALNMAIALVFGRAVFGRFAGAQCAVLYLALEDNHRRLQSRAKKICAGMGLTDSRRLHFITEFPRFDDREKGLDHLEEILSDNPDIRLVIVDTLARVRGAPRGGRDSFGGDYDDLARLQQLALKYSITILVIHHTTKAVYPDAFDSINGTTGITAPADTLLVLKRTDPSRMVLTVRGRDVEESETAMTFDKATGLWQALGDASFEGQSEVRRAILDAVPHEGHGQALGPKQIATVKGLSHDSVRQLCRKMANAGQLIWQPGGKYLKPLRGGHSGHTDHNGHPSDPGERFDDEDDDLSLEWGVV